MSTPAERAARRRATWTGGVARTFEEAEDHDLEFWLAATPQERIRGVTELIAEMHVLTGAADGPVPRLQRSVGELGRAKVEYVLVGGYAVAFHGRPRATKDIDLVLRGTAENLERAASARRIRCPAPGGASNARDATG